MEMDRFRALTGFALISSAAFGFFLSPLMDYGNKSILCVTGLATGIFLANAWMDIVRSTVGPATMLYGVIIVVGSVIFGWQLTVAQDNYASNRARCQILQKDMLSMTHARPDSRDLFQALNCQPWGDDPVQMPAGRR